MAVRKAQIRFLEKFMSSSTFIKGSNILRSPPSHSKHGMEWEIAPASPGTERTMRLGILFGNLFVLWLRSDTFLSSWP